MKKVSNPFVMSALTAMAGLFLVAADSMAQQPGLAQAEREKQYEEDEKVRAAERATIEEEALASLVAEGLDESTTQAMVEVVLGVHDAAWSSLREYYEPVLVAREGIGVAIATMNEQYQKAVDQRERFEVQIPAALENGSLVRKGDGYEATSRGGHRILSVISSAPPVRRAPNSSTVLLGLDWRNCVDAELLRARLVEKTKEVDFVSHLPEEKRQGYCDCWVDVWLKAVLANEGGTSSRFNVRVGTQANAECRVKD